MLKIFLVIFVLQINYSFSQCAIYANQKNGALGWAYNSINQDYTFDELKKMAEKSCEKYAEGYNCEKLYHSLKENGWCCVMRGYNGGLYCFAGSCGNKTEQEAIDNAKKNFNEKFGSIEYEKWTWRVYANSSQ